MAIGTVVGAGTKLEIKTGTSTYKQVKGFLGVSGLGGGSAAVIDATDMDSVAKEKAMGLPDEGQCSVNMNYIPKDDGQVAMKAARNSRVLTGFRVTLPDTTKIEFNAFVLTFERSAEGTDELAKASSSLEISGAITETVAP